MKVPANEIKTEVSGAISEQSFGIADVGFVLEILRNKLYKNPILALTREYAANARDAHREVGKLEVPIEIHLPNHSNMHWECRDFGPGISPDRMEKIFTKFGASTKRDTNLLQGQYGIGAKSSWAYVDSFSIISNFEKTKRVYNAYIDETRVGKLALISETPTSDQDGCTIKVPVQSKDIRQFIDSTVEATQYWDVKPILKGVSPAPKYPVFKVLHAGPNWQMLEIERYNSYDYYSNTPSKSLAVVDGIGYPIDPDSIAKISLPHRQLLSNRFHLLFGNGEVSLSASRDSLHYDERTVKLLVSRITEILAGVKQKIQQQLDLQASYLEACQLYQSTLFSFNFSDFLKGCTWKSHKIILDPNATHIGEFATIASYYKSEYVKEPTHRSTSCHTTLLTGPDEKVYHFKDQDRVPRAVVDRIFADNPKLRTLKILCTPLKPSCARYQALVKKKEIPEITYNLEMLDLLKMEELPKIDVPRKTPKARIKGEAAEIIAYALSENNGKIHGKTSVIPNTEGVYVEYEYDRHTPKDPKLTLSQNLKLDRLEKFLGQSIHGFSKTRISKLEPGWKTLGEALEEKLATLKISIEDLKKDAVASYYLPEFAAYRTKEILEVLCRPNYLLKLNSESIFSQIATESARVRKSITDYKTLFYILKELKQEKFEGPFYSNHWKAPKNPSNITLCKLLNKVKIKYPLLERIGADAYNKNVDQPLIDYLNSMDELESLRNDKK